jgi:hypothetical protein
MDHNCAMSRTERAKYSIIAVQSSRAAYSTLSASTGNLTAYMGGSSQEGHTARDRRSSRTRVLEIQKLTFPHWTYELGPWWFGLTIHVII